MVKFTFFGTFVWYFCLFQWDLVDVVERMWSLYTKINIVGCCMLRLVLLNLLELLKLCVSCDCKHCSGSGWLSSCGRYPSFSGCCFWVEILWLYYVVGNVGCALPFSWVFWEFCFSLLYVVFASLVLVKL